MSRRVLGDQSDDSGTLIFSDSRLASDPAPIREAIYSFGIEAVETLSHGLRMAAKFFGYPGGSKSSPAQRVDAGAEDPVTGGVAATG